MDIKLIRKTKKLGKLFCEILFPPSLRLKMLGIASHSTLLSSFVATYSGWLGREAKSILRGQLTHHAQRTGTQASNTVDGAVYTLRRSVHRLEKGLIMRPRKPVFALDYIQLTVDVYQTVLTSNRQNTYCDLLQWAVDVLSAYFSVVDPDPVIDKARLQFDSLTHNRSTQDSKRVPYRRDSEPLKITIEDLKELAIRRRSCRWFLQKPVPREMIDKAIEVAGYAPSACNRQPFEFRVYDNSSLPMLASVPMGTRGFADNFPCIVVIVGTHAAFPFARDRHLPYIDSCLAAMGFQFALEVQGLSSCCINWPDIPDKEAALRERIELEDYEFAIMFMAIGYPDPEGMVPYSQKKPLDSMRSYNKGLKC